jgi:hypothetical protein
MGHQLRNLSFLIFLAFVFFLIGCLPEKNNAQQKRQEALEAVNKPIKITIGEQTLYIPLKYVLCSTPQPKEYPETNSIFIKIVYPDFSSVQDFSTQKEYQEAIRSHRLGGLYLGDASSKVSMPKLVELKKTNKNRVDKIPSQHGMEGFNIYYANDKEEYLYETIFIEKNDNGDAIGLIQCHPERYVYPQCNHKFVDNNLFYSLTYNKNKYFPEWKAMKRDSIKFVNSLKIKKDINNDAID